MAGTDTPVPGGSGRLQGGSWPERCRQWAHSVTGAWTPVDTLRRQLEEQLAAAEAALVAKRKRLAGLALGRESLERERLRLRVELDVIEQAVDAALLGGEDDVARRALHRGLDLRRRLESCNNRLRSLERDWEDLSSLLTRQQRDAEELCLQCAPHLRPAGALQDARGDAPRHEEVELELLRRKRGRASGDPRRWEHSDAANEF